VVHVHEDERRTHAVARRALTLPLTLGAKIICVSRSVADFVCDTWPHLRARVEIVHNGLRLLPDTSPEHASGPPVRIVLVGRLSPAKGQDIAIEAVDLLRQRGCDATLDLVGGVYPGYEAVEAALIADVHARALAHSVFFAGHQDDVRRWYAEGDIIVVPSRNEPFGLVALEAMAAARPVLGARVGGLAEVIEDGENGLLFEPGNALDLAAKLMVLIEQRDLRRKLVTGGLATLDRFSSDRFRDRIVSVIAQVARRPDPLRREAA
jgi:hypothetical protein